MYYICVMHCIYIQYFICYALYMYFVQRIILNYMLCNELYYVLCIICYAYTQIVFIYYAYMLCKVLHKILFDKFHTVSNIFSGSDLYVAQRSKNFWKFFCNAGKIFVTHRLGKIVSLSLSFVYHSLCVYSRCRCRLCIIVSSLLLSPLSLSFVYHCVVAVCLCVSEWMT